MNNEQAAAFYELLLDSSSSDDSSDDQDAGGPIQLRPRIRNYIEVVDNFSEEEFRENFRLTRQTFNHLLARISSQLNREQFHMGRLTIDAKVQLLLTLWHFGTPDSYRSICSRFGIGKATGLRAVRRVTIALLHLAPNVIKWPTDRDDQDEVIAGFENMGFPNTIGAIDGSYIPIPKPRENGRSYICRKKFPAINLTAVVDASRIFTYATAGEVGATHDAEVLRRSELWQYLTQPEKFPNNCHIIGDKAYPLLPQLMTPFREKWSLNCKSEELQFSVISSQKCSRKGIWPAKGPVEVFTG